MLEFSARTVKKSENRNATTLNSSGHGEGDILIIEQQDTQDQETNFVCGDLEFLDFLIPSDSNHDEEARQAQSRPPHQRKTVDQTTGQAAELASADGGSPRKCEKRGRFLIWPVELKLPEM